HPPDRPAGEAEAAGARRGRSTVRPVARPAVPGMTMVVSRGRMASINGDSYGRHPGRAWRPAHALLAERMAGRAARDGARWPRVAAAALVIRGLAGDDVDAFAV